ncbi:MAG: alpha/beta fold hydrolase, partial [Robiginitalea sp.]
MELLYSNILGEGTPLLVLHGFLGMSDNWKTLGRKYAESGYEVHLLDQRNHGRSFWSTEFDYPTMAEDVKNYMDAKGISSGILHGHSMGGKTSMHFACTYPERVDKLIVVDIAPKQYPPHHQYIISALASLGPEDFTSRTLADKALSSQLKDWGIRQFLLKSLFWQEPGKLGFRFNLQVLKDRLEEIGAKLGAGMFYEGPVMFLKGG